MRTIRLKNILFFIAILFTHTLFAEDLIINGENDSFTRDLYRDFIDEFVELDHMRDFILNEEIKGSNRNHDKADEQPRYMRSI